MEVKSRIPDPPSPRDGDVRRAAPTATTFPTTFAELLRLARERHGDRVFLRRRTATAGGPIRYSELADDVDRAAAGLASCGIEHGDRIALMAENSYSWMVADLGAVTIGAVDVPRGVDTTPTEMVFILRHSGCRFAFVENDTLARELMQHRDDLPDLEMLCSLQDATEVEGIMTMPELLAEGDAFIERNPSALDTLRSRVHPGDLLTIVYTSGTTADPKGVMLSHANVLSNARTANQVFHFGPGDCFLSMLPPWHMYERMLDYLAFSCGAEIVYTNRRKLKQDLANEAPTAFAAVPRVWETVHDGIIAHIEKLPPRKRRLMRHVIRISRAVAAGRATRFERWAHRVFQSTVLKSFTKITGGRLRLAVSGGGALPPHVDEALIGIGIPLINGYGLTETSPVASVRLPADNRCGTIGPALPETSVEIRSEDGTPVARGETGLIWIKGPGVMQGYYDNPERTAQVLVDGWFNSGDLGNVDAGGHIRITGRAKDTIVLAGGENVEPEHIETAIKTSPYVQQAVVLGQDRKALGALLVVDGETLELAVPRDRWQIDGAVVSSDEVRRVIRAELDRLVSRSQGFRPAERVASFVLLLEPMTPDNGLLTPTLKVRRHIVAERYRDLIARMFA